MRRALTAGLFASMLLVTPGFAQDRQAVFDGLHAAHGGVIQGHFYMPDGPDENSQYWRCQTCGDRRTILIGYYDYAYTYDTSDGDQVLRMIGGACRFDPCSASTYTLMGIEGLRQEGPRRDRHNVRTSFIVADRLIMLEARDFPSAEMALAAHAEAEAALIQPILQAAP